MFKRFAVILLVTVALAAGSAMAQTDARWGLIGGLNFAGMGGDMEDVGDMFAEVLSDETGYNWSVSKGRLTGIGVGAFYVLPTSKAAGLQIEGHYMRRGVAFDLSSGTVDASLEFRANYFEIPVLLRYAPASESSTRFVLLAGPVVGFKTGDEIAIEAEGDDATIDAEDMFKSTTIGALGGLGLCFGDAPTFTLQARYYLGLTNAIDDDELSSTAGDLGVFAGVEFPLNK